MLTLESFEEAAAKVKEVTQETKLIYSSYFSDMTGNNCCISALFPVSLLLGLFFLLPAGKIGSGK